MSKPADPTPASDLSRRQFVKGTSATLAALAATPMLSTAVFADEGKRSFGLGIVGAGGRGTGAVSNCLSAAEQLGLDVKLVAMADLAGDRLEGSFKSLERGWKEKGRFDVGEDARFVGVDCAKPLCNHPGVDIVIHTTPPGLRFWTLREAVLAGKHSFVEKPVCVDPFSYRHVLESGAMAVEKGLAIVSGTQYRRENSYRDAVTRLQDGIIGDITGAYEYYCAGTLWHRGDDPSWTRMEYQMRNWLYYAWLSGDLITEQSVHNIDAINWIMDGPPEQAFASGGRIARDEKRWGNIYDHFAVDYDYPGGVRVTFQGRQYPGCTNKVENRIIGTKGTMDIRPNPGRTSAVARDHGGNIIWKNTGRDGNNAPYVEEHKALLQSLVDGKPIQEIQEVADSSLTAVLGRESAYSGRKIDYAWLANESKMKLSPENIELGEVILPYPDVRVPGTYKLV